MKLCVMLCIYLLQIQFTIDHKRRPRNGFSSFVVSRERFQTVIVIHESSRTIDYTQFKYLIHIDRYEPIAGVLKLLRYMPPY